MKAKPDITIKYRKNTIPEQKDILKLYSDTGWHAYASHPEILMSGFNNSLMVYGAWAGDELAGLA